jgi:hypothetical protein
MRRAGTAVRSRKRHAITRRDHGVRRRKRVWVGSRARVVAARPFFFALSAQQMERVRPIEVFGAATMLLAMASCGALAALLGS